MPAPARPRSSRLLHPQVRAHHQPLGKMTASPEDLGRLPQDLETAIFRMVQECLTNIHRHSESPVARIRIRRTDSEVSLEVEDRGKGIPPEKRQAMDSGGTAGVGIRGMRERLRQLGGSLEINSNDTGTVVVARLPVASTSLITA